MTFTLRFAGATRPRSIGETEFDEGIFTRTGSGNVVTVASTTQGITPTGGNFISFADPTTKTPFAFSGNTVAFWAEYEDVNLGLLEGIFTVNADGTGNITTIATTSDTNAAPNGTDFNSFDNFFGTNLVALDGNTLAFVSFYEDGIGLFTSDISGSGDPTAVVTINDLGVAPGGGDFFLFTNFGLQGDTIAFFGVYTVGEADSAFGLFKSNLDGTDGFTALATTQGGIAPGGTNFSDFFELSVYGDDVAFLGAYDDGSGSGIFLSQGTGLPSSVIQVGDSLFGGTVIDLSIGSTSLEGKRRTFAYQLDDGRIGIAVAVFAPEPGTIALLLTGIPVVGLVARRKAMTRSFTSEPTR